MRTIAHSRQVASLFVTRHSQLVTSLPPRHRAIVARLSTADEHARIGITQDDLTAAVVHWFALPAAAHARAGQLSGAPRQSIAGSRATSLPCSQLARRIQRSLRVHAESIRLTPHLQMTLRLHKATHHAEAGHGRPSWMKTGNDSAIGLPGATSLGCPRVRLKFAPDFQLHPGAPGGDTAAEAQRKGSESSSPNCRPSATVIDRVAVAGRLPDWGHKAVRPSIRARRSRV